MKGLYIHIPFCSYICHYCDFVKQIPKSQHVIDEYIDHLIEELKTHTNHFSSIDTIYIGGGTPSMLTAKQLERILVAVRQIKPVEFSIEINPDTYTNEKGLLLKKYGINRISLGVQTFNLELLKYLGRHHTTKMVDDTVESLKAIGITNISVDLMFGIPRQTLDDIKEDIKHIEELNINHISYYSLILEDKTYFYHQYLRNKFTPVDDYEEAAQYQFIIDKLEKLGFKHYEISNFAKEGYYSKHNLLYWTLQEYIGVGLGAHGFVDGYRTQNNSSLIKYKEKPVKLSIKQTNADMIQDELIFGLRLTKGISLDSFKEKYGIDVLLTYPKIKTYIDDGLLKIKDGYLFLTPKGMLFGNQVFMLFI